MTYTLILIGLEKKQLEREVSRKDKALAETAALLTLSKKPARFGGGGGQRGRVIDASSRAKVVLLVDEAVKNGAAIEKVCELMKISDRTYGRWSAELKKTGKSEDKRANAIRRAFKNQIRPDRSQYWCLPSKNDAEFVAAMNPDPEHGSRPDIAEIELNMLTCQCLSRRIATVDLLQTKLAAWEKERNKLRAGVNRQFKTSDARIKLVSLHP